MSLRYSERVSVEGEVLFSGLGVCGRGRVLDVSLPGCLLESTELVRVGDYIRLKLCLSDQLSPIQVSLAVVRRVDGDQVGVEFIRSPEEDQARLIRLVKRGSRPVAKADRQWETGIELIALAE